LVGSLFAVFTGPRHTLNGNANDACRYASTDAHRDVNRVNRHVMRERQLSEFLSL